MAISSLLDLDKVLKYNQHKLTAEEASVFLTWKSNAVRALAFGTVGGCLVGSGAVLAVASKWNLSTIFEATLFAGAGTVSGLHCFSRSIDSTLKRISALDGSLMQTELVSIIVKKHPNDPWAVQCAGRILYPESVYDESSSDGPIVRWRFRHSFLAHVQGMHDNDSHRDSQNASSHNNSSSRKAAKKSEKVPVDERSDMMEDPIDCIFGYTAPVEEIQHPGTASKPARVVTRRHRRSQRRHRVPS